MSRAFVKEDDGGREVVAPRAVRQHPYYVTPDGYREMQQQLARAQAEGNARDVEDLTERVASAIVIDPRAQTGRVVKFGASVTVEGPDRHRNTYRIVGEDEADPRECTISWLSPLTQALLERRAGARVIWERPAGNLLLRIVSLTYRGQPKA